MTDIPPHPEPDKPRPPLWYKDAVIYQLHIKAFADSNADGIGDFPGLIAKLPYLKELGASAVWLLPFYPSPLRDDGYDIADYKEIHPSYGTMADFRAFVKAAHELDLRVITELVVNHTSDAHPWFERARNAPAGSELRGWYVWSDTPDKYAETRIIFTDTEKSNWSWDPVAKQYYWHRFFSHQPDLNFDNPQVFDAIVDVMRFWFEAGVDGVRLDAVPYLCEREGTNNENLPETHAVLKHLRAVLDAEYPDRFLLAEANQWPEDVAQYFGNGDECHMAFHFPLMPRMFMSIAEEDRYPIYDIMRQTPAIPDNCQWAMFLRNHDELTLEMVTDRERAFMYRVYATEARARVNVGIRRRLAPLMENDRRRIELMTSLLLSMPGTPILYYGDEIGMGDNIYLGDRDGVRTPMQWSGDRNGGFSTADAQRLFLPSIMDAVYGYPAVNVESQQRSPSSLLNWIKRLIAVRQAHSIFGRGTITFMYPQNRKVAAYLREFQGDVVLCVANLARTPQAVSLDLSRFAGRVPIEMIGWSPFPTIVDDRYVLTLPGHAFFWFSLSDSVSAQTEDVQTPHMIMPEFMTLVLPHGRTSLTQEPNRTLLETEVAPPYLAAVHAIPTIDGQRSDVRLVDAIPLGTGEAAPILALFAATMEYGDVLWNALPLELSQDDGSERNATILRAAVARARTGRSEALLIDASGDDVTWVALERALRDSQALPGTAGTLVAQSTWSLNNLEFTQGDSIRRPTSHGRHVSAIIGETMLVTLFRRSPAGINAEVEVAQYLHDAGYAHAPPLLGTFRYEEHQGEHIDVGLARRFILNRGDAWEVTQTFLQRFLERRRATPVVETEMSPGTESETRRFVRQAHKAGARLADLHLTLARDTDNAAFGIEPVTQADRDGWKESIRRRGAFIARATRDSRLSEIVRSADKLTHAINACGPIDNGQKIRIHGDFHLARVLVTDSDLLIVDSGAGDEFRPPAERRQKRPPLLDVVRMLRSFDAAANTALRDVARDRTEDPNRFAEELHTWVRGAADAFRDGYAERMRGSVLDTGDAQSFEQQLAAASFYDAVEGLAVAIVEKSPSLDFYAQHLATLLT